MQIKELKNFRKHNDLTQPALAELIGVSPFTVKKWEQGQRALPGWLPKMIKLLEGPTNWAIHVPGKSFNAAPIIDEVHE